MIKEFQVLKLSFYELLTLGTIYWTLKLALLILSHSSLTKIPSDKKGKMKKKKILMVQISNIFLVWFPKQVSNL